MKPLIFLLFFLGLLVARLPAEATSGGEEFVVKSWRTPDGLQHNYVQAITQTPDGYLWIGTRGGLARFDGVHFRNYGLSDGLPKLHISDLQEDGQGGMWIGMYAGGLSHMQDGKITNMITPPGAKPLPSASMLAAAEPGGVWAGGNGGLQHWGPKGFVQMGPKEGFPEGGEVLALASDGQQGLWVATDGNGLFFVKNGRCDFIEGPPNDRLLRSYTLLVDGEGDLWTGLGNTKVMRRHGTNWTEYNQSHGLPVSFIYCMAVGPGGEIWAGSQYEGLYVFRDGRFQAFTDSEVPIDKSIHCMRRTADGIMWLGSRTGGLTRMMPRKLSVYPLGLNGRSGQLQSLVEEPPGNFWVTTFGNGLFQGKLGNLTQVAGLQQVEDHPFLMSGLRMTNGTLFFGGFGFLVEIKAGTKIIHNVTKEENLKSLCEDIDGSLWIGNNSGELKRWENGAATLVPNGKFPATISYLLRDPKGGFWVGTTGEGFFHWEAGQTRHWGHAEGLPFDNVTSLHEDKEGVLWIATSGGGLAWLRDGRIQSINQRQGLGDNFITQMVEDDEANLWLGCARGIYRVSKREIENVAHGNAEAVHPLALNESDGMLVSECTAGYSPSGLRSHDGLLLFATGLGVVAIDPKRYGSTGTPPQVLIEDLLLDGNRVPRQEGDISLTPGPREVEIRYTAFNFAKPQHIRFRHRLDGVSTKWDEANSERSARFPLLPPGQYVFHVSAANEDGRWSERETTLAFTVQPFFWQTVWFKIAMALLLLVTGGGVVAWWARARLRRARTRERLARADVEEMQHRNKVAHLTRVASLGELSAALAHELNQPLTAILSNAQAAQRFLAQKDHDPNEIRDILQDIVEDDQRASEVIERLRALLKKGEFHLQPLNTNDLILGVLRLMQGDLASRAVTVILHLEADLPSILGDRVQLQQVLINLVLNARDAMAATAEDKRILTLQSRFNETGSVQISVMDTGSGLPPGSEDQIFEAYHTTKSDGLGLGLSLSLTILLAHSGRLWAENRTEGGAVFHCILPAWNGEPLKLNHPNE